MRSAERKIDGISLATPPGTPPVGPEPRDGSGAPPPGDGLPAGAGVPATGAFGSSRASIAADRMSSGVASRSGG